MVLEHSYGIIPLRKQGEDWHVLLIQHGSAKYWGFPKGHAEQGETPQESAVRELFEETHLKIVRFLSEAKIEEHYNFFFRGKRVDKTVWYFVAEVEGNVKLQKEEVSDSKWIPLDQAVEYLTYKTDKSVCLQTIEILNKTN